MSAGSFRQGFRALWRILALCPLTSESPPFEGRALIWLRGLEATYTEHESGHPIDRKGLSLRSRTPVLIGALRNTSAGRSRSLILDRSVVAVVDDTGVPALRPDIAGAGAADALEAA